MLSKEIESIDLCKQLNSEFLSAIEKCKLRAAEVHDVAMQYRKNKQAQEILETVSF